jgi:hypothetical protein
LSTCAHLAIYPFHFAISRIFSVSLIWNVVAARKECRQARPQRTQLLADLQDHFGHRAHLYAAVVHDGNTHTHVPFEFVCVGQTLKVFIQESSSLDADGLGFGGFVGGPAVWCVCLSFDLFARWGDCQRQPS